MCDLSLCGDFGLKLRVGNFFVGVGRFYGKWG